MIINETTLWRGPTPSNEELVPTRFILRPPPRQTVADHLRSLVRRYGRWTARACRNEMIRIGCFPVSFRRADGSRYLSGE